MIPLIRPALDPATILAASNKQALVVPSTTVVARKTWRSARSLRATLKENLERAAFKAAFCMYCYESRGTDVDHFKPIDCDPGRTFDWNNHVLACGYCNQQAKREIFPLDQAGNDLLLDPFKDDSGHHLALGTSGKLYHLSDQGEATLNVLGLNARIELVESRRISHASAVEILALAGSEERRLTAFEWDKLGNLAVVDALHYLIHDVASGRFERLVADTDLAASVSRSVDEVVSLFPKCSF